MQWNISINAEKQYAEIITKGIADYECTLNMAKAVASEASRYKTTKILIDHSNIEDVLGEITDIYARPREFQQIGIPRPIKIAEIIRPEHKEHFKFLELVLLNQGFEFLVFNDREAALEWLMQ